MNRRIHNLQQGSQEWHDFRAKHFGASELPAAAGVSKYTTRGDLLREKATGISKEVDANTQALFNRGHAAEAFARTLAEKIVGDELSPRVMSIEVGGVPLSASLDGITFDRDIIWEHKLWSEKLAAQIFNNELEPHYLMQMDQQLLVSGAKKCLFMTSDGTADNCAYMWYDGALANFEEIVNSWKQFQKDLANYQHVEVKEPPKAEAIAALPSVFVQATGMVTASNLAEFKESAAAFIAAIKTELVDDQDFADADATAKFCKQAEGNIESVKQAITGQMSSVDDALRTLDHIAAQLRDKRLMLDKLVKSEKEARKLALVRETSDAYAAHLAAIGVDAKYLPMMPRVDFAAAIKGLKSLASMHGELNAALANAKVAADAVARDIRAKLYWCKENATGHGALFPDLQALMAKPMDDFALTITSRIEKAEADEAARLEAKIRQIEAEAKVKAEREASERLAAEAARIQAEKQVAARPEQNELSGDDADAPLTAGEGTIFHERLGAGEDEMQRAEDQADQLGAVGFIESATLEECKNICAALGLRLRKLADSPEYSDSANLDEAASMVADAYIDLSGVENELSGDGDE